MSDEAAKVSSSITKEQLKEQLNGILARDLQVAQQNIQNWTTQAIRVEGAISYVQQTIALMEKAEGAEAIAATDTEEQKADKARAEAAEAAGKGDAVTAAESAV